MDLKAKLAILADAAKYDASCASSGSKRAVKKGAIGNTEGMGICHSYTPDGRCVSLLKILLTNFCLYDCVYCINRVSSDIPRARFTVSEVVWLTMEFYRRNYIEGLFLSSGVMKSSDETMGELIEIARRLREEEKFGGYVHIKAIAGCSQALIEQAGLYADRLSANIELPTPADLSQLAPAKSHSDIETSMAQMKEKIAEYKHERKKTSKVPVYSPAGQSTQMIVGATPSSDAQILQKASTLYKSYDLRRVYYSAFSPIPQGDPRLPLLAPPLLREHRLYQADWLLRFYGFSVEEITPDIEENLSLDFDPKLSWALRNLHHFPVDVNRASRSLLLRVPGFGVNTVKRILTMRKIKAVTMTDLKKLKVPLSKAKYFINTGENISHSRMLEKEGFSQLFVPETKIWQPTIFDLSSDIVSNDDLVGRNGTDLF